MISTEITDEMLKAGDTVLKRADFSFWEKMTEAEGHELIRAIYLAMTNASPTGQDDGLVRHIAAILEEWDMKEPPNEFTGHPYEVIAQDIITRAIQSSPTDEGLRSALDDDEPQNFRELAKAAIMDLRRYAEDELPHRRLASAEAYEKRFELLNTVGNSRPQDD